VLLKDLGKGEMKRIIKDKVAREIEALEGKLAMPPHSDGRLEAIADFLENGLDHEEDPVYHMQHEFGLRHEVAQKLFDEWQSKMIGPSRPQHLHQTKNLLPWIEKIVHKSASQKTASLFFHEFPDTGKKPSSTQIKKVVLEAIKSGHTDLHVSWGENAIHIKKENSYAGWQGGPWSGDGWIRPVGGQDLANEINKTKQASNGYIMFEMPTRHAAEEVEAELLDNPQYYKVDSSELYMEGNKIGFKAEVLDRPPNRTNITNLLSSRHGKKIAAPSQAARRRCNQGDGFRV
jgi:hypothetical protein